MSVGVSLLVCVHLRVAMQPQVRPVLPHEANHHLEAARCHLVVGIDVRDDAHLRRHGKVVLA